MIDIGFWKQLHALLQAHDIVIDRPKGSTHPRYPDFYYPLDYGYLSGTSAGDGQEIDIWLGSGNPSHLTAIVCTVDSVKQDTEVKLLAGCTESEAQTILGVHNSGPQSAILIMNPYPNSQAGMEI